MFNYGFISLQQNASRLVLIDFYITRDTGSITILLLYYQRIRGCIDCADILLTLTTGRAPCSLSCQSPQGASFDTCPLAGLTEQGFLAGEPQLDHQPRN